MKDRVGRAWVLSGAGMKSAGVDLKNGFKGWFTMYQQFLLWAINFPNLSSSTVNKSNVSTYITELI